MQIAHGKRECGILKELKNAGYSVSVIISGAAIKRPQIIIAQARLKFISLP